MLKDLLVISSKDQNFSNVNLDEHEILINFDSVGGNWKALNGDKEEMNKVINKHKSIAASLKE